MKPNMFAKPTTILIVSTIFAFGCLGCQQQNAVSSPQDSTDSGAPNRAKTSISEPSVPEGYEQILPRGGIPAIDNPKYVSADEANILDDSFVLGVVIEGQAVAYSLNLLNSHEIVNDTIGKTNFAAVW
jgi:hypothetical protein